MSPLTKLFVVLLVLVSVALSAGTITFVNKLDPIQKDLALAKTQNQAQQALTAKANESAASYQQALEKAQGDNNAALSAARAETLKAQQTVAEQAAQIAQFNTSLAVLTSTNNSATTALSASEAAKTQLQDQVSGLRKDADDRLRQVADLGQRVNKLVADLDQTEKARRNLAEQLADVSAKSDRQAKAMTDAGITTAELDTGRHGRGCPGPQRRHPQPPQHRRQGIRHDQPGQPATTSTKGMQFKIIDAKDSVQFPGAS